MIGVKVVGPNFDDIIRSLEGLRDIDLIPLAERLKPIMIRDNRDGLLAGTDSFGDPMADVMESTVRRGRHGDGPPLVPGGETSSMIAAYDVEIRDDGDRVLLIGGWPMHWVRFHATGTRHMVARDPLGIRPNGVAVIAAEVFDFAVAATLIGGHP
jgi:hypothetical protein